MARRTLISLLLFLAGAALVAFYLLQTGPDPVPQAQASTATRLPTALPVENTASPTTTPVPSPSSTPLPPTATPTTVALPPPTRALTDTAVLPLSDLQRFGVTGSPEMAQAAREAGLVFGSYAGWAVHEEPYEPDGITFWQLVNVREEGVAPSWTHIDAALAANPGSIWLIGNEPDVNLQNNVTAPRYAELYHELYTHIKERDPSALVAIGGVGQPTLLRRAYLDIVLDTYRERYGHPLPVDIFNVHAFVLREEEDSWGVGIPPGMDDGFAMKYELDDHDNLSIFRQNIIEFRAWMAERGYGDRPLVVSEYGILMPNEYGFPPEAIADFMRATFDFFRTARNETGYPADDHRLVQWWFWFYIGDDELEEFTSTFLQDPFTGELTPLGEAYTEYVATHVSPE